jgi:predicted ATP-dependent endonuclease of OLD family
MRLQRVQISNFRVLKDIDITFEEYYTPQTFFLASQNGGGKSTLLQLVFVLLRGCYCEEGGIIVENLLKNSNLDSSAFNENLSTIMLIENKNNIKLEVEIRTYESLYENYLFDSYSSVDESQLNRLKENGIDGINIYIKSLEEEVVSVKKICQIEEETRVGFVKLMDEESPSLTKLIVQAAKESSSSSTADLEIPSPRKVLDQADSSIKKLKKEITAMEVKIQESHAFLSKINTVLLKKRIRIVHNSQNTCSVYKFSGDDEYSDLADLSKRISDCIFIAAPSSQVFLFLSPKEVTSLFESSSEYYSILKQKQEVIDNLFFYEFSLVKILADVFRKAFDNDRLQALRSGGKYGNEFELLLNDLKNFLNDKTIQPSEDMSEIVVRQKGINNQEIEFSLAELSHGELRRLSFYAWLKVKKIKHSIVLIDEIEISLHPDWQYQIVRDLEAWEPSNQYILATHSYDICSALSPSHVKEIEPKLLKAEMEIAQ